MLSHLVLGLPSIHHAHSAIMEYRHAIHLALGILAGASGRSEIQWNPSIKATIGE